MSKYDEAAAEFRAYPDKSFIGGPAGEPAIADAEARLGATLPGSYRAFLREFGWGGIPPLSVFGLGTNVPPYLDLVGMNEEARATWQPPLPAHLVAIAEDGGGNLLCLDTGRMRAGECPVVFWSHDQSGRQVPMAMGEDFGAWLLEQVTETRPFRQGLR